jgi:outer membrane protein
VNTAVRISPTRRARACLMACSLLLLILAPPAAAQEEVAALSLEEAQRIARQRSPALLRVASQEHTAAAQLRQGYGGLMPSVSASMTFSGSDSHILTGNDEFGQPIIREDPLRSSRSSASQRIGLNMMLFDGGGRFQELRAARAGARVAEARTDAERLRLDAEVARIYYDALSLGRQAEMEERQVASARERLEATERLFRVAAANREDVLGAQVDLASRERAQERAAGEAAKARLRLREAMGITIDADFRLTSDFPVGFDPASLNVESLVAEAVARNPAMAAAEASADEAARRRAVARSTRWPTVSAGAGYNRSLGMPGNDALFDFNPPDRTASFDLTISVPIFNQYRTAAAIAQADVSSRNAAEELRATRLRTEREVREAVIDLQNAYRGVQLAERAAEMSRERMELALERYRVGALQFTQLQQVIDSAAAAERDELAARLAFAQALAALEQRVGTRLIPAGG